MLKSADSEQAAPMSTPRDTLRAEIMANGLFSYYLSPTTPEGSTDFKFDMADPVYLHTTVTFMHPAQVDLQTAEETLFRMQRIYLGPKPDDYIGFLGYSIDLEAPQTTVKIRFKTECPA